MRTRNLLTLFAILLFSSVTALAQTPPPARPATPPAPPEPMAFSFFLDGANYLGITPEDIHKGNLSQYGLSSPRGVGVSSVSAGGPADKAGLKKGDVILQFDGETVTTTRKLQRLISEAAPEQTVRLTISRNGSEQQLSVTLGKRESAARGFRLMTPEAPGGFHRAIPGMPQAPGGFAPEVFSYSFGSNRRVGISTQALTKQLADFFGVSGGRGLLITSVSENSPASKAGLKAGDVITEVDGEKVEDMEDFLRALNRKDDGEISLTIIRDKSQRTIKVTPERRQGQTFNFSELQPAISRAISPRILMNMPDVRVLQAMPRLESLILPKIETLAAPRLMNLPRVAPLITPELE